MHYVFEPTPVPTEVTLYEALAWVAFNFYPVMEVRHEYKDRREDLENYDDAIIRSDFSPYEFFNERLCEKYGLPSLKDIRHVEDKYDNFFYIPSKEDELREQELREPFKNALDAYLELPKAKLFVAIKEGRIKSTGREILNCLDKTSITLEVGKTLNDCSIDDLYELARMYDYGFYDTPEFSSIDKDIWSMNNINWEESWIRNGDFAYCHILVDWNELISEFPANDFEKEYKVHMINGQLVMDVNSNEKEELLNKKQGRPSKFNWKEFTTEMVRRFSNNELPKMQKSCVIDMQEWCKENWGIVPSETNLKNYISPFYQKITNQGNKSKSKSENKSESQKVENTVIS